MIKETYRLCVWYFHNCRAIDYMTPQQKEDEELKKSE